ncbi:MAG: type II secretion system GspH family protein [bacterium]|nr:type II secretion system GspH family protein [bacterium]
MKKNGFTLAEVLVTLGIVGVIAALTIPTFTQSTSNAKIGPMLGKAKSSFEQATTAMLNEAQSDSLTEAMLCPETTPNCTASQRVAVVSSANYTNFLFNLGHYLKGSRSGTKEFRSEDGVKYLLNGFTSPSSPFAHDATVANVEIDINGEQDPNTDARDVFYFEMRNDGSLVPFGIDNWQTKCAKNTVPTDPKSCAAHVFENGLKAEYR